MDGITMDNVKYRVRVSYKSLRRAFQLLSGENAGTMKTGRENRDLLGTAYSYALNVEPDPAFPADYDAFYEAISAPVESHSITMPYGQSTMSFQACVESGEDTYSGKRGGIKRWTGLTVRFSHLYPQRLPE